MWPNVPIGAGGEPWSPRSSGSNIRLHRQSRDHRCSQPSHTLAPQEMAASGGRGVVWRPGSIYLQNRRMIPAPFPRDLASSLSLSLTYSRHRSNTRHPCGIWPWRPAWASRIAGAKYHNGPARAELNSTLRRTGPELSAAPVSPRRPHPVDFAGLYRIPGPQALGSKILSYPIEPRRAHAAIWMLPDLRVPSRPTAARGGMMVGPVRAFDGPSIGGWSWGYSRGKMRRRRPAIRNATARAT